jgi:Xaa-Pro aminopeptidase
MAINLDEFRGRRELLIKAMGEGVAIIPTSPELVRNRDSHYPYRFDSYFYYLSAFKEPESVLFIMAGANPKTILFCRDKDMEREIWDGFRYGPNGALAEFGFDEAYSIGKLDEIAPKLLANQEKLFYSFGAESVWDLRVNNWLNQLRSQARTGVSVPNEVVDVRKCLDEMRLYKSAYEIAIMRHSSDIALRHISVPCSSSSQA